MAHLKCFSNESDKINSGIYTSRKKARAIYRSSRDLANNGGVYHKSTNGQNRGTYVGDVKISQDGSKCLIGASSYESLLTVTQGKYLESPDSFDLRTNSDIWTGNLYVLDLSGTGLYTIDASAGGTHNTFPYPPDVNANNSYPTTANGNGGLIVDPCFNIFYPQQASTYGNCYLNNERSYIKNVTYINYQNNKNLISTYIQNNNGYTGSFYYPQKFVFDACCNPMVIPPTPIPDVATTFTYSNGSQSISYDTIITSSSYAIPAGQSLTKANIGTKVTTIGNSAFQNQSSLTEVTFEPYSILTTIEGIAFESCTNLITITIPSSVVSIATDDAFILCTSLQSINVESGNAIYSSDSNGVLFNLNKTELYQYPLGNSLTTYTVPNTVTTIGYSAFYFAQHLTNISIPASVTSIGNDAFGNSPSLTTINIPPLITNLGYSLFGGSTQLATIIFDSSNNLLTIGDYVFQDTAITSITLPNSVTSIGSFAFFGAVSLSSITIPPPVTSIGSNAFLSCTSLTDVSLTLSAINALNSAGASPPIPTGGGALSSFYGSGPVTITVIPEPMAIAMFMGMDGYIRGAAGNMYNITDTTFSSPIHSFTTDDYGRFSLNILERLIPDVYVIILQPGGIDISTGKTVTIQMSSVYTKSQTLFAGNANEVLNVSPITTVLTQIVQSNISSNQGVNPNTIINISIGQLTTTLGISAETLYVDYIAKENSTIAKLVQQIMVTVDTLTNAIDNPSVTNVSIMTAIANTLIAASQIQGNTISLSDITNIGSIIANITDSVGTHISISEDIVNNSSAFVSSVNTTISSIDINTTTFEEVFAQATRIGVASNTITRNPSTNFNTTQSVSVPTQSEINNVSIATIFQPRTIFAYSDGSISTSIDTTITSSSYTAPSGQSLTKVDISHLVTVIDDSVFYGQTTLVEVIFEANSQLTSIGGFAFGACPVLASFTIPALVTSIGAYAFMGCMALTTINVEVGNTVYSSDSNGVLFDISNNTLIQYPIGNPMTEYTIPNTVTGIGDSVFFGAGMLTSLTIPQSVTSIAAEAFAGSALTIVRLESELSLTTLGLTIGYNQSLFGTLNAVTIEIISQPQPETYIFNNTTLRTAVNTWTTDRTTAIATYGEIKLWNVSNVTDMSGLFINIETFNDDISDWDTSNVTTMNSMFTGCTSFNQPLTNWNTSKVIDMSNMFYVCINFDQSISNFDTSNVTNMTGMFGNCTIFNQSISNLNTSKVTDMSYMFSNCTNFNQSVSNFDTSNVTTMNSMFNSCTNFNQSVSNFNTSMVTDMVQMFTACFDFNQSVSNFDTSNVTTMMSMFVYCYKFNQPLITWNTSRVTNMDSMFYACTDFNQNIRSWVVTNETSVNNMFYQATAMANTYGAEPSFGDTHTIVFFNQV